MKNNQKLYWWVALGLGIVCCLWLASPFLKDVWLLLTYYPVYHQFDKQANELSPRYDAINEEVYRNLPKPVDGAIEKERRIWGTGFTAILYGRQLSIKYQLNKQRSEKEMSEYYIKQLTSKNWILESTPGGSAYFTKGAVCLDVDVVSTDEDIDPKYMRDEFTIRISPDFFKQDFSPAFPEFPTIQNMNAFEWYTFGEAGFITCPPYSFSLPRK